MKKFLLTAIALASLSTAGFAVAGGEDVDPSISSDNNGPQGGFYIGVGAGWGSVNSSATSQDPATVAQLKKAFGQYAPFTDVRKKDRVAAEAHAGYLFKASDSFLAGLEAGFQYLPETHYTYSYMGEVSGNRTVAEQYTKINDYGFDLLAVAKFYLTDSFDVFAKAGAVYINQKTQINNYLDVKSMLSSSEKHTKGKVLPEVAAGVGYNLTQNIEVTATYTHAFGKKVNPISQTVNTAAFASQIPSFNSVLLGLDFKF